MFSLLHACVSNTPFCSLKHMPKIIPILSVLFSTSCRPGQLVLASTTKLLLGFSQQISLGMHYLATKGYIHRDIAARNIFLTEENTCKVSLISFRIAKIKTADNSHHCRAKRRYYLKIISVYNLKEFSDKLTIIH